MGNTYANYSFSAGLGYMFFDFFLFTFLGFYFNNGAPVCLGCLALAVVVRVSE